MLVWLTVTLSPRRTRGRYHSNPQGEPMKLSVFHITPCLACGQQITDPQDKHPRVKDGEPVCTPCAVQERTGMDASQRAHVVGLILADALGTLDSVGGAA